MIAESPSNSNIKSLTFRCLPKRWCPKYVRLSILLIQAFLAFYKAAKEIKPRTIHCHDVYVLPVCLFLNYIHKSKLIYDSHELASERISQSMFEKYLILGIEKFAWSRIDHFISVSPKIVDWYLQRFGQIPNTVVLNAPVVKISPKTKSGHHSGQEKIKKKLGIGEHRKLFVYVGLIGYGRGIRQILEAFATTKTASDVVLIGWGPVELVQKFSEKHNNIHFHKKVNYEEVVSFISDADYGLALVQGLPRVTR